MSVVVNSWLRVPQHELQWRFVASGGPGGQHANKTSSRVQLSWNIAESTVINDTVKSRLIRRLGKEVRVEVDEHRSQLRNRELAQQRIAERIAQALVKPKKRKPTKPTRGSKRRRLKAKRQRSETKKLRKRITDWN